jgi:anti-sigma regulatory factor (Ser/Thr protein kinase)
MTNVLQQEAYRHEALIYSGEDDFVAKTSRFLRDGVAAGEPALVVVSARKIERLRESLNGDADGVLFADMAGVGQNPARIIPAWRDFVSTHAAPGVRLRGIGEPIYPERSAVELVECQRHEALLNVAFQDALGFWLLCPYDSEAMPAEVIDEAKRTHPYVMNGESRVSETYYGLDSISQPFSAPLSAPPADAAEVPFDGGSLARVRVVVRDRADAAGFSRRQRDDFVLAVSELAANSVRHGGGKGVARIWQDDAELVCEIVDAGRLTDPLAGRVRPRAGQPGGHGLWLATQLCDLVQIRPFPDGTTIRVRTRRR